ncbi:MAG: 4Fe-4S binding protein, partial [Megasphaera sp.]|nr:4Fe-4S binding protein [Megasphaera sp.]
MHMGEDGLPVIDKRLCTGCGKCASICPNHVIELLPISAKVAISCSSKDFGAAAMKNCKAMCIGCGSCMRNCSHQEEGAIKIVDHLAVVNQAVCHNCDNATCMTKCPTGAINEMIKGSFKKEEKVG